MRLRLKLGVLKLKRQKLLLQLRELLLLEWLLLSTRLELARKPHLFV